ncbi:glycosyltransferase 87 family protein [uncultured Amnibacterium sp.]|uniref:glycosyltransferase 87 family protein n=1 Tax=uncultured Amnibacterium sp. TaxID=1631851 RepID=UPI0035CA9C00
MTEPRRPRPASTVLDRSLLAAAFVVTHVVLSVLDYTGAPNQPAGDVTGVYRFWIDYWHATGSLVGIDTEWVYPVAALPPMLIAGLLGDGPYLLVWLVMVAALDAVALVLVARRGRALAWWWLAFTALLGPVALARIDAIALPLAVVGVLLLADRPAVAATLLTLAAWIKVWPAALVAAVLLTGRRLAVTISAAALTSAVVIGLALLAGARGTVFSFVSAQATRGLQVEAPVAIPWLWSAALGDPGVGVYYDTDILTFQLRGDGVQAVANAMIPVLAIGVVVVTLLALLARLRRASAVEVLAVTSLGYVSALVALNKVGSPQYLTWYVAPVILGLLVAPARFRVPAVLVLVAAVLTQLIYPWFYGGVTTPTAWVIGVLTIRNAIQLALLVWCLIELRALPSEPRLRSTFTMPSGTERELA